MSYRLIDSNAIAIKYPEVNEMPCVFANLPDGMNGQFIDAQPEPREGHWIRRDCGLDVECKCSRCGYKDFVEPGDEYWFNRNFCPNCGAKMKGETKEEEQ